MSTQPKERRNSKTFCYSTPSEKAFMVELAEKVSVNIGAPFTVSDLLRTLSTTANVETVLEAREKHERHETNRFFRTRE